MDEIENTSTVSQLPEQSTHAGTNNLSHKQPGDKAKKSVKRKRVSTKVITTPPKPCASSNDVIAAAEVFYVCEDVYIKEFAYLNVQTRNITVIISKPPFGTDAFNPQYKDLVDLQTVYHHHIPWNAGTVPYSEMLRQVLDETQKNTVYFYSEPNIPNPLEGFVHQDLKQMGCPHPNFIHGENPDTTDRCPIHAGLGGACAMVTVRKLLKWFEENVQKSVKTTKQCNGKKKKPGEMSEINTEQTTTTTLDHILSETNMKLEDILFENL